MQDTMIFLSSMPGRRAIPNLTWLSSFNLLSIPVWELSLCFYDLLIFLLAYWLRSNYLQPLASSLPVKSFSERIHGTNSAAKLWGVSAKLKFYLKNRHRNSVLCLSDSPPCFCGISWAYDTASWGKPSWTAIVPSLPHHLSSEPESTGCWGYSREPSRWWLFCSFQAEEKAVRLEFKVSDHRLI